MKALESRSNPKLKQIRALRQRKEREATGLFVVEGIHHVGEAVEAGAPLEYIVYSPERLTSEYARRLVDEQSRAGTDCYAVPADLFSSLAEKENPQGILAVARARWSKLEDLDPDNFPWGVALVAPQDPGNIGSILRCIDAVGASGLLLLDTSADPYHASAVRASMGAVFWYPLVQASFGEFREWVEKKGYTVYGTSAKGTLDYREVKQYRQPMILLMGSEREGLSAEQKEACDVLLRLPMQGRVSSLNLAVATGILLYTMAAQLA